MPTKEELLKKQKYADFLKNSRRNIHFVSPKQAPVTTQPQEQVQTYVQSQALVERSPIFAPNQGTKVKRPPIFEPNRGTEAKALQQALLNTIVRYQSRPMEKKKEIESQSRIDTLVTASVGDLTHDQLMSPPNDESKLEKYTDNIQSNIRPEILKKWLNRLLANCDEQQITKAFSSDLQIDDLIKKYNGSWITCPTKLLGELKQFVDIEITSTLYILRIIGNSVISINGGEFIKFDVIDQERLTGVWRNDKNLIKLIVENDPTPRLIMAFGPSASGKSEIGRSIIRVLNDCKIVGGNFLKIDGGDYRKLSMVYKNIIEAIRVKAFKVKDFKGFTNMHGIIFDAGFVKKTVSDYLLSQNVKLSLYVPETLGKCMFSPCTGIYSSFISISNSSSNWIALNIYQHLTGASCSYQLNDVNKCVGCEDSGKAREQIEGKKYSSFSYQYTFDLGNSTIRYAPGGYLKIHNCGRSDGISVIEDVGVFQFNGIQQQFFRDARFDFYKRGGKKTKKRKRKLNRRKSTKRIKKLI